MPLIFDENQRRRALLSEGLNPDEFDIDPETGNVFLNVKSTQPALQPQPQVQPTLTPATTEPQASNPVKSFFKGAASGVLPTLGGAGGASALGRLGLQIPGPLPLKAIAGLTGAVAGAVGGSALTDKVQNMIMPKALEENLAQTQATDPGSYNLGRVASSLVAFKPDFKALWQAGKTGGNMLMNALPGKAANIPIASGEVNNLVNIGAGVGLGAGVPVAQALATDQPIDPKEVLVNALGNAILNNPNKLAQALFKFAPNTYKKSAGEIAKESGLESSSEGGVDMAKFGKMQEMALARSEVEKGIIPPGYKTELKIDPKMGAKSPLENIEQNILSSDIRRPETTKSGKPKIDPKTGQIIYKQTEIRSGPLKGVAPKQDVVIPYRSAEESAGEILRQTTDVVGSPVARARNREVGELGTQNYVEQTLAKDEAAKTKAAQDEAGSASRRESNYQLYKSMLQGGRLGDSEKFIKTLAADGPAFKKRYAAEKISGQSESFPPLEPGQVTADQQKLLAERRKNYQPTEQGATLLKTAEAENKSGKVRSSKKFYDIFNNIFADKRNVKVDLNGRLVDDKGQPVRGATDSVREGFKKRVIEINPNLATPDTLPHEYTHSFYSDLAESPNPRDKATAKNLIDSIRNSEEFKNSRFKDPEEFMVETTGYEIFNRAVNLDGQNKGVGRAWKDFMSRVRLKWGNAKAADVNNFLTKRFFEDPAFVETHIAPRISGNEMTENIEKKGGELKDAKLDRVDEEEDLGIEQKDRQGEDQGLEGGKQEEAGGEKILGDKKAGAVNVKDLDGPGFLKYANNLPPDVGGMTGDAKRLGNEASSMDEIEGYKTIAEDSKKKFSELVAADKLDEATGYAYKAQYFREAYETATGTGSMGMALKKDKNFKPSVERISQEGGTGKGGEKKYQPATKEQTETPEFKKWFGDSKVVDKEGKPLVVYHGTGDDFTKFNVNKKYGATGTTIRKWGSFFTPNARAASEYAWYSTLNSDGGGNIKPVYLSLKNPKTLSYQEFKDFIDWGYNPNTPKKYEKERFAIQAANEFKRNAIEEGHDGFIINGQKGNPIEIVAFEPTQIKSATGNQGTFDASNPDIRYQKSEQGITPDSIREELRSVKESPDFKKANPFSTGTREILSGQRIPVFGSELDKFELRNGPSGQQLSPAIREALSLADNYYGKWGNKSIDAAQNLNSKQQDELYSILLAEQKGDKNLSGEISDSKIKAAYETIRETFKEKQEDQIAANQPVMEYVKGERGGYEAVPRLPKVNPNYFPQIPSARTLDIVLNYEGSQAFNKLKDDFVSHQMDEYKISRPEALDLFEEYKASFSGGQGNSTRFGAVRKAEGVGLPTSWLENNLAIALRRYWKRATMDRAWYDAVESDPNNLYILGQNKDAWGETVTPTRTDIHKIPANTALKNILSSIQGTAIKQSPVIDAASRIANNLILGPITAINDLISAPVVMAKFSPDLASLPKMYMEGIKNWAEGYRNAKETGRIKTRLSDSEEIFFQGSDLVERMRQIGDSIAKVTGRQSLENASRGLSQAMAESSVRIMTGLAENGDKKSIDFLTNLANKKDWKKLDTKELASRIVDLTQGTYDIRGLPSWVVNSPIAPLFRMSKWNIEQLNNLQKYAITPAIRDKNFTPLLTTLLGGAIGGYVAKEAREFLTNKEGNSFDIEEIINAPGDVKDKILPATYSLAAAMSYSGSLGFLGEVFKSGMDIAYKNKPSGLNYPLVELTAETADNILSAAQAIVQEGENPIPVAIEFIKQQFGRNVQVGRLIQNWTESSSTKEPKKQRQELRKFKQLAGLPFSPQTLTTGTNPFVGLEEKKFKGMTSPKEIASEASAQLQTLKGKTPEEIQQKLRRLKSGGAATTMPSPENSPMDFKGYYDYLVRLYGKAEADRRVLQFGRERELGRFRRSLIPSL